MFLIAWVTDTIDGTLARKDHRGSHTWIGDNDLTADVLLALSTIIYFTVSGIISLWISIFYFAFILLVTFVFTSQTLFVTFIALAYALYLLVSYFSAPRLWWIFILWIVTALLITWNRFWENVRVLLSGLKDIEVEEPLEKWLI